MHKFWGVATCCKCILMLYKCLIAARKVLNVSDLAKEILLIHLVEVS